MFSIAKKSIIALIGIIALPARLHESATVQLEPSSVSWGAIAGTTLPVSAQQPGALRPEGVSAKDQSALAEPRVVDRSPPAPTSLAKLRLEIGDKLKIGFYETIDIGSDGQSGGDGAGPQSALRTFYQRMDLSGEYTVELDGSVSIPLLGQFEAEGRALDDIRADLVASFVAVIGRSANVDARIVDRAPIYVVGPVKTPGAYKYAPGMIVLQAIALAGGLDRGADSLSGMVEGAREMERFRVATLQVEQLLAKRARLETERDGMSALSLPTGEFTALSMSDEGAAASIPARLAESNKGMDAETPVTTEGTILRAEQARRRLQEKEIGLRVAAARNEVDMLKHKLDQFIIQKDLRTERLVAMQQLKDRGVETSNNVLVLRTELADIEARRQDSLVAVADAEARLAVAEEEGTKLTLDYTADLAKEIQAVDKQTKEAQEAVISAKAMATILNRSSDQGLEAIVYNIVRQSRDGAKELAATETSSLMPGDILKVTPGKSATIAARSVASSP